MILASKSPRRKEILESFGFEMSFPKNNSQGLGFEPWHWRLKNK